MKIETEAAEANVAELEPLSHPSDEQIDEMMHTLGYDALDDSTPENMHERGTQMKKGKLYKNFHAAGKHGELFVLRGSGDRIIGLLGLRADAPNQTGHITLLRTATRESAQTGITEKLLAAAERYLRQSPRGCDHAVIEGPNPSERVRMAARHGHLSHFYEFQEGGAEESGDEEPRTHLEKPF